MGIDNSGARRQECAGALNMRLKALQTRRANQFDLFDAILFRSLQQMPEMSVLAWIGRDDKLAALTVRHASFIAIVLQHAATTHAKQGLEPIRLVVEPCMDDLAVAR
jgi:hypothetical protein